MKVSPENIATIKSRLERLYDEFNINPLDEDEVKIGDEDIFISYPDDDLEEPISVDDFMLYTSDLDGINKEDDSTVRMGGIRQTILRVDRYYLYYLVPDVSYSDDLINMGIIENPVLVGLVASKEGIYNEEFGVYPCSMYTALELRYKTEQRYTKDEEDKIIERFLYHIAAKYDISIEVGTFDSWEDITGEEPSEPYQLQKDSLIPYSEAMRYYANALRINDPDIQFHHLYKIIEHFSPRVSKKMAYEMLNQRLDALSIVNRDCQYLDSLLELAKHYQTSLKDKELCKTVLQECVDIIPIFDLLPEDVQSKISLKCSFKIDEIGNCADSIIAKIKDELGDVIYETRNRIVHAKSNWGGSDKACSGDDMEEMNDFMKALAQCLIIWNGRQPKEFRI
ncbi:MAG: hypothetical protein IJ911_14235 [Salinivirgaceae bacterium]|nr:hypothetical protein [Salinivirgaceae bacterium]